MHEKDCKTCHAIRGELILTNVPRIFENQNWIVEHTHPSAIVGWIVVVLRRHCAALHELTSTEFEELGTLLRLITREMSDILGAQKEYVMQFAEAPGHNHVHFHIVAKMLDWPSEYYGAKVFGAITSVENPVTTEQVIEFTNPLSNLIKAEMVQVS